MKCLSRTGFIPVRVLVKMPAAVADVPRFQWHSDHGLKDQASREISE